MVCFTAACMTWELAESGMHFITTVINGADLVPTFSAASVDDLRSEVSYLILVTLIPHDIDIYVFCLKFISTHALYFFRENMRRCQYSFITGYSFCLAKRSPTPN